MPGILYLVPNTLGSTELSTEPGDAHPLEAIIPRQVQVITAGLDYFVAENAKSTRAFLKLLGSSQALARPIQEIEISELNVNTPAAALPALLAPLLAGRDGGLISEAGVPAVADPGANLVRLAHQHGIQVRPLVGPSSLLLAVMASGLNGQSFAFNGYLPTDAEARSKRIRQLEDRSRKEKQTQLLIETPYRNGAMLDALAQSCQPGTLICVATDLSLPTETVRTQTAAQWQAALAARQAPDFHKKPTVFLLLAD
ncbi:SAM-dependent methyltransferase [Herbaspirillum seropedicae]|uniref:Methyltransferase transmembrane protein n=1 Tax=Herbaspirillum seropedicae (strain SmR1) TaxID=757424 RepID=D8IRS5_HERSS|nr:SAM-dependent methyltransferase [Herbaspirillum seropedicae]ADJ63399.1 methyltransferase transmembrane protein [Herbaspirillum seropedicae SmR1]AKN65434.1 SAM-dependent methyltransferase [Herbaspirillum seropedicae]NQE28595.1 SAM-dependent methyltransferase [Herbaspirillum seropedicae]UMU21402.1 SAM-dependent methyltransferase [Herbaspirillum seropedicae]